MHDGALLVAQVAGSDALEGQYFDTCRQQEKEHKAAAAAARKAKKEAAAAAPAVTIDSFFKASKGTKVQRFGGPTRCLSSTTVLLAD